MNVQLLLLANDDAFRKYTNYAQNSDDFERAVRQNLHCDTRDERFDRIQRASSHSLVKKYAGRHAFIIDAQQGLVKTYRPYDRDVLLIAQDAPWQFATWFRFIPAITKQSRDGKQHVAKQEYFFIDEVAFAEALMKHYHLLRINDTFYNAFGSLSDSHVKALIQKSVEPIVIKDIGRVVSSVFSVLCGKAYRVPTPPPEQQIHLAGGIRLTISMEDGSYSPDFDFDSPVLNRLSVEYDPAAQCPVWDAFLNDLLTPQDAATLQEYIGYLLLPKTDAQKCLFLIGQPNCGKSRVSRMLFDLFKSQAAPVDMERLFNPQKNRFELAAVENRMVIIDDDCSALQLKDTSVFKKLVISQMPIGIEKKGIQGYSVKSYARMIALSNYPPKTATPDMAWYRRMLWLQCLPKPQNRIEDKQLSNKISSELSGILNWALIGLQRLIMNEFTFTVSSKSKAFMDADKAEQDKVAAFMSDGNWLRTDPDATIASSDILQAYEAWCGNMDITAYEREKETRDAILKRIKAFCTNNGFTFAQRVKSMLTDDDKGVRGYRGLTLTADAIAKTQLFKSGKLVTDDGEVIDHY